MYMQKYVFITVLYKPARGEVNQAKKARKEQEGVKSKHNPGRVLPTVSRVALKTSIITQPDPGWVLHYMNTTHMSGMSSTEKPTVVTVPAHQCGCY